MQSFTDSPLFRTMGKKRLLFCFFDIFERQVCFLFFSFIPLEVFLLGGGGGGEIDDGDGNTRRSGRNEIRERKRFLSLFRFFFPPPPSLSPSGSHPSKLQGPRRAPPQTETNSREHDTPQKDRAESLKNRERGRGSRETRGKGRNQEPRKRKKEQQKKPPM